MRPVDISEYLKKIGRPDITAAAACRARWNSLAKPLGGLGSLEEAIIKIAGISATDKVSLDKKLLVVMCADNGVVKEGVSQSGFEVTKAVCDNFPSGATSACIMSGYVGADVWPVDIGVFEDTLIENKKIARGTKNIAGGPAMSKGQAEKAILLGIEKAALAKQQGYKIIAAGEMGIANTTTAAAVASVLLKEEPEKLAGRGAGLDDKRLENKICIIKKAIEINRPDRNDPVDILSKVGGFDLCGMCGLFIGGAVYRIPVVMDGFISSVAALCAVRMNETIREFMLPSHLSKEPAAQSVLSALGLKPFLDLEMHLGEGTGAVALFPLLDMALGVYYKMPTFEETGIEKYEEFKS